MKKTKNSLLLLLLVMLSPLCVLAQAIVEKDIRQHISILASDEYEGRGTGYEGAEKSAAYISNYFKKLKLQPKGENGWFQEFNVKNSAAHNPNIDTNARKGKNVIAFLDNKAENTIIIGAHYDHLGFGKDGNSLEAEPQGKIHNGADDNASGVAGVLALAKYYAQNKKQEKYNFLFICFSAEELGLLGSNYFAEHPTIPLNKFDFMLNMDMIGRLQENKSLIVGGIGTSPAFGEILKKHQTSGFKISVDSSGVGASDHTSFYVKNIPVLFFFTGVHTDYHKASDDTPTINFAGEVAVLNFIATIVNDLEKLPKITFTPTKVNQNMSASTRMKVTMGVMPNYANNGKGLEITAVSEGKPAKKAGLQAGDIIQAIGKYVVTDVQTYMEALGNFNKGETAEVKILRGTETIAIPVTF
ncbi:MAG: M20/M25/M40 family metallo-hydrolase [Verrucomicrobia bacterium]|nr:M20/M25/M40 family metallo-hydrolase [Cytophagales bacterium]